MAPEEYLRKNYREEVPGWLLNFSDKSTFKIQDFFKSRVVFYPGCGEDGHAVKVFGSSHSAHCFVYADYSVGAGSITTALDSLATRFAGYQSIARKNFQEKDLSPDGWSPHATPDLRNSWNEHIRQMSTIQVQSFGFLEILQRNDGLDDSHGASRLAILFLGADGHAAYDALFCQDGQLAPFAVLLQDHGFGGNYCQFGRNGFMSEVAVQTNRIPELLLVGRGTDPWPNFQQVEGLEPTIGGWAGFPRLLYKSLVDTDANFKNIESTVLSGSVEFELKKYYVYALIDSRRMDESGYGIFYIGKGSNKRVLDHVKNVNAMINSFDTEESESFVGDSKEKNDNESSKVRRIKEINDDVDAHVIECIVGRFDTAEEAFAVEATLIEWVYGREKNQGQLTNIQPGRYSKHIRSKGNFDTNERLDIPKKVRLVEVVEGKGYLKRQLDKLIMNNTEETAELLADELRSLIDADKDLNGRIEIGETVFIERGRYVGSYVKFLSENNVVMRLQCTSMNLTTTLWPSSAGVEGVKKFTDRMKEVGLEHTLTKVNYGRLPEWKDTQLRFTDYEIVLNRIREFARVFDC
jgi:hypothetical protein